MTAIRSIARTMTVVARLIPRWTPTGRAMKHSLTPYAGYGSVLFNNIYLQQVVWTDSSGTELSLRTVAAAMRNVQATIDGVTLHPFSPEGATHFFIDKRLKKMAETG